jgi:predicted transglutaminase-like cysteine proteinase
MPVRVAGLLLTGLTLAVAIAAAAEPGFSRSVTPGLIAYYERLFGRGVSGRLLGWQEFVRRTDGAPAADAKGAGETQLLAPVNRFFNRLRSMTDQDLWGVEDYWATPAEALSINGADCEDYAIAKYFTLKELGIPVTRLRLVYATTWLSKNAHLVLAYYPAGGADPLILDNVEERIKPAGDRPDLIPVFTFNEDDVQMPQKNAPAVRFGPGSNRKWAEVLAKLQRELEY